MAASQSAGKLSTHAQQRVFERTHLTPLEVQILLDQHQFWWVAPPVAHQKRYALVFDTVAKDYLVAIVAPDVAVVKTVLTLAQFEVSHHVLSEAVKLLARMALLGAEPSGLASENLCWRLTARMREGKNVRLPVLTEREILDMFSVQVGRERAEIRHAVAVLFDSAAFLQWFSETLQQLEVPLKHLNSLLLEVFRHDSNRGALELDLTGQLRSAALRQRYIRDRLKAAEKQEQRRLKHESRIQAATAKRLKRIEERERAYPRKNDDELRRDYGMDLSYRTIVAELTHPRVASRAVHADTRVAFDLAQGKEVGHDAAETVEVPDAPRDGPAVESGSMDNPAQTSAADEQGFQETPLAASDQTLINAKIPGGRGNILKTADAFALING